MDSKTHRITAAICSSLEGPDAVQITSMNLGQLAGGKVRIAVKAAALNFPDLLMTYGKYQFRPELPFVIGMEGAGVIVELPTPAPAVDLQVNAKKNTVDLEVNRRGENVDLQVNSKLANLKIGDAVTFRGKTGAIAEQIDVDISQISPIVPTLTFEEAAAFGVTFQTAYVALVPRAKIKAEEVVLVHGAGGGVGQAAVATAKALGATVIATASSAEKLAIAEVSGADYLINYTDTDFAKEVIKITAGRGANVILDPVGGTALEHSVDCIAWQGRILSVGFASGSFGRVDLARLQQRGASIVGVRAGEFGRRNKAAGVKAERELFALAQDKNLKPYIGKIWSLQETVEALKAMENRSVLGKQVVKIQ